MFADLARTVLARIDAVDAQPRVALDGLPALDVRERLDRVEARILRQRERDRIERRRERANGVLLDRRRLPGVSSGATGLRRTSSAIFDTARLQAISAAPPP